MKHIITAIMATISIGAFAQSENLNDINHVVREKAPIVVNVTEVNRNKETHKGVLRIEFWSDDYPVSFLVGSDTLAVANSNAVQSIDLNVPYVLTETYARQYDMHVVAKGGSKVHISRTFGLPPIAELQTK